MSKPEQVAFLIILFLGLGVACQSRPSGETSPFTISTATPGSRPVAAQPNPTAPRPEDYAISDMPQCQGLTDLRVPLKFDWPDIEEALEKLEEYNWGYYTCALPQPELLILLHENMPKPPYLWREVNHANYAGGTVTLFYQPFKLIWIYIWMLPRSDKQTSYMVIAKGDPGVPQTWECRLLVPQPYQSASYLVDAKHSAKTPSRMR